MNGDYKMQYLQESDKLDINIEIVNLHDITDQIKTAAYLKQDQKILLYSERHTVADIVDALNKNWSDEFYDYLQRHRLAIADVVTAWVV